MAITIIQFTIDGSGVLTFYYTGSWAPGVTPTAGSIVDVSSFVAPNDFLNGHYTVTSVGGGIVDTAWFKTTIVHAPAEGIRLSGTAEVEAVWPEPGPEGGTVDNIGEIMSSSASASLTLVEICFPDITGKVIRGWGQVVLAAGGYVTGGLPMGLIAWLDARTVDFNGFLRCEVWDEEVQLNGLTRYHYNPVTDTLQIFTAAGVELASGVSVPLVDPITGPDESFVPFFTQPNLLMFEVSIDRTTVRG